MRKSVAILFSIIFVFSFFMFVLFNFVIYPRKFDSFVSKFSLEQEIDSALVFAVIKAESNFDERAISAAGAVGLMQILPTTAKWIAQKLNVEYSEEMLFDPETNIRFGCFYLKYLICKFKDEDVAICAYNAGEGIVRGWLDENGLISATKIPYPETKAYLEKVKRFRNAYSEKVLPNNQSNVS